MTALGNYDLDAVGCGGCVTPKGWLEIHNPASQELKLKLFHMPNMGGSGAAAKKQEGESGGDSLKEIGDLEVSKLPSTQPGRPWPQPYHGTGVSVLW